MSNPGGSLHISNRMAAVPSIFLALSVIFVGLRIYVRIKLLRAFPTEDWLCLIALLFFVAQAGLLLGFDALLASPKLDVEVLRRIINVRIRFAYCPKHETLLTSYIQSVISDVILYLCASIALKLSLAFFFVRFVIERWQRVFIWVFLSMFIADSVSSIFLVLFWCSDPSEYATKALMGQCSGTSRALNAANVIQGVLNAATDWLFATLPISIVLRTAMSKREKVIVTIIFILAVAGSIAAILRAIYWPTLTRGSLSGFRRGMMWCTVEIGAGIIASSAATLRPLLKKMDLNKRWNCYNCGRDFGDGPDEFEHSGTMKKMSLPSDVSASCTEATSDSTTRWQNLESVSPQMERKPVARTMQF